MDAFRKWVEEQSGWMLICNRPTVAGGVAVTLENRGVLVARARLANQSEFQQFMAAHAPKTDVLITVDDYEGEALIKQWLGPVLQ